MAGDQTRRAYELFAEALHRQPDERAAFLDQACAGDHALRGEVESLLSADVDAAGLVDPAGGPETQTADGVGRAAQATVTIEGYEVLSEIHRGGQGVVYKAVQKATKRTVALKILLEGPYASARLRHRFEREIDLVAGLQHPQIVTVYDSGVTFCTAL